MKPPICPYLSDEWRAVRDRYGMTLGQVIVAWQERRAKLLAQGFSLRDIRRNRLDNPFVRVLALRVLMNDLAIKRDNYHAGVKRNAIAKATRSAA